MYGNFHLKQFNDNDLNLAHIIRFYRQVFGNHSPHETFISINFIIIVLFFCVDYCFFFLSFFSPNNIYYAECSTGRSKSP